MPKWTARGFAALLLVAASQAAAAQGKTFTLAVDAGWRKAGFSAYLVPRFHTGRPGCGPRCGSAGDAGSSRAPMR